MNHGFCNVFECLIFAVVPYLSLERDCLWSSLKGATVSLCVLIPNPQLLIIHNMILNTTVTFWHVKQFFMILT